jgi:hypothetical protein
MFVHRVTTGPSGWTNQKRVQRDGKMKIPNDKMSQQIRMALPPPHSLTVSLLRHVYKPTGTARALPLMIHDEEKSPATYCSMLLVRTARDLLRMSV